MSQLELDIGPHTIETSHISNMTLCTEGVNPYSVSLVATLAFPSFCSHFQPNTKMLPACLKRHYFSLQLQRFATTIDPPISTKASFEFLLHRL